MKKLESSLKNMLLVLTAVTAIATGLLAYVNELTKEPIALANAKTLNDAIKLVVPAFTNNPTADTASVVVENVTYIIYKATKDNQFVGAAVLATENGFGGAIKLLVGFDAQGNIIDYSVLSHTETPGLGSKMDPWFKTDKNKQSIKGLNPGKEALTVTKDGGNIDAITASTITSRAFLAAVNKAYQAYAGEASDGTSGATQQVKVSVTDSISQSN